jgi:hypothetical protein
LRVAVRTPDTRLAGQLNDHLPALSSRLEQTGYRAEAWQTVTVAPEGAARGLENSSGGNADFSGGEPPQDSAERRDNPERRRQNAEEDVDPKPTRKEFSWFVSNLQ